MRVVSEVRLAVDGKIGSVVMTADGREMMRVKVLLCKLIVSEMLMKVEVLWS